MTPEEWAAAAAAAKDEYDRETRDLKAKLERARTKVTLWEKRLAAIDEAYRARAAQLGSALMGIPGRETPTTPTPGREPVPDRRRGTLDEPVLALAREIASPDVTSKQIETVWNQRDPGNPIRESTVRSILKRLHSKGLLELTQPGGGAGKGIPTKYRPV